VILVLAWAAVVADHVLRAEMQLRTGIAAAQRVRSELSSKDIAADTAQTDLGIAAHDFTVAHAEVSSAWLDPLHVVPILRTQVRSVEDLTGAAATVTEAGKATLATAHTILHAPPTTPAARTVDLHRLATAVAALEQRVAGVSLGPDRQLFAPLARRRDTFADDLATLQSGLLRARGATAALADVLAGPRTYLLVATNNAEMRAGSGMMLEAGSVTFNKGNLTLGAFGPTSSLVVPSSKVVATGDLAARWGYEHPTLDFRDLLLSPQFPPNAALAARMWRERTGQTVDGVATVDVAAVADLLAVTGPISLNGTTYTASNVAGQLLIEQYVGLNSDAANAARHEQLGELAALVLDSVEHSTSSLTALAQAFDDAANGRHIQVWAATPRIEADWTAAGVGGAVSGDDVLLSLLNQGANKLDPYQQVTATMRTRPVEPADGQAETRVTVRVTIHNKTPTGLSDYAAGGYPGDPPARQYTGAVALDFPTDAGDDRASGGDVVAAGPDYGSQVVAIAVAVPAGQSHTVTFSFTVLGASGDLRVLASARLPPTEWYFRPAGGTSLHFDDSSSHTVMW
jgi:hypothetical protein